MPICTEDILENILSRLPVPSLLQFRCVCKLWNSPITSAHFIKMHLHQRTSDPNKKNNQLLFILAASRFCFKFHSLDLARTYENNVAVPEEVDFPLMEHTMNGASPQINLLGSCKGLILLRSAKEEEHLFLLNPSTRESKQLPVFPFNIVQPPSEFPTFTALDGFGYDYIHDDYKMVRIVHFHPLCSQTTSCDLKVVVYTLSTNAWRVIGTSPYTHRFGKVSGTHLNGAIHWIDCRDSDDSLVIASFDLAHEIFWDLPLQSSIKATHMHALGFLGSCLCVTWNFDFFSTLHHDVWVMRKYGVRESWTNFRITDPRSALAPLCFLRNHIVLWSEVGRVQRLVLYDSEKETSMDLLVDSDAMYQAASYVESLVSPFLGDEIEGPC